MKKILLGTIFATMVGGYVLSVSATFKGFGMGATDPATHLGSNADPNPVCKANIDIPATIWLDPGMIAATGVDLLATKKHNEKTVKTKKALKQLEEALEGGCSGESGANDSTTLSAESASVYCSDTILSALDQTKLELSQKEDSDLFQDVRGAVKDYVFESSAADLLADCSYSGADRPKNCAVEREDVWLMTSVALASSTADKVLANSTSSGTSSGVTPLKAHFEALAEAFNAQTSPKAMYGKMADIVLDTHTQMNESNALLARDLEAQSLRAIRDAGPVYNQSAE